MQDKIIEKFFKCPLCGCKMSVTQDGKSAKCSGDNQKGKMHSFDFSTDGYLSFGATGGDSKEAVRARSAFLNKGYYSTAAKAVVDAVKNYAGFTEYLVDAGCGEGYYTQMLSECSKYISGFDLSKFACMAGAKRAKRDRCDSILYATASVFELPVSDGSADVITNIFAPCAEEEYTRALKSGGILLVAGAGKNHLMGLKKTIYDNIYENGERADLPVRLTHIGKELCRYEVKVCGKEDIATLFSMTPYYWRTSENDKRKLEGAEELTTEIEFEINVYKKDKI